MVITKNSNWEILTKNLLLLMGLLMKNFHILGIWKGGDSLQIWQESGKGGVDTYYGSILGPTLFLLYTDDLPDVICDIAIYVGDTTLYSKCDQASSLWQQLELASEIESDIQDTVDWDRKWLVDFKAGKI